MIGIYDTVPKARVSEKSRWMSVGLTLTVNLKPSIYPNIYLVAVIKSILFLDAKCTFFLKFNFAFILTILFALSIFCSPIQSSTAYNNYILSMLAHTQGLTRSACSHPISAHSSFPATWLVGWRKVSNWDQVCGTHVYSFQHSSNHGDSVLKRKAQCVYYRGKKCVSIEFKVLL